MFSRRHRIILFKIISLAGLALAFACCVSAQITVTAPAANQTIVAADDFATKTFQDPWDMNQMTDLGWFTYAVDAPVSCLTNIAVSGGIFSATTVSNTAACPNGNLPNFMLLDPIATTAIQVGKVGTVFPIDSTKYRRFLVRMNLSGPGLSATPNTCTLINSSQCAHLLWNLYGTTSTSNPLAVYPGQWIYAVDLPTLGSAAVPTW